ncbi:hypothetical protein CEUSTIGMA_g10000.t1 [Chlamydomonas eustigma]|uniref:Microsomal glutathione S-transferase 1 n=1 Tax=Chlamydomonas eustigma TaxID=1157962 RepID=A0A250XHM1_9CHLO|nr:hypothetical protein CEUSTIGMA_g10000.t1 [Chlamydomonas eustigma]|eukprot:GAX82574.1 hypothetical protein CEUSTIGMA_g10000.t1 [Chlamydomonas eustigma]
MASADYVNTLAKVAGALAIKTIALSLLTVRARLIKNDFSTGRAMVAKEDTEIPPVIVSALKVMTVAVGPSLDIGRLTGCQNNGTTNEPFFLAVALSLALAGSSPAWGAKALTAYLGFRVVHMGSYLFASPQPLRAVSWLGGTACTLALAVFALLKRK